MKIRINILNFNEIILYDFKKKGRFAHEFLKLQIKKYFYSLFIFSNKEHTSIIKNSYL